MHRFKELKVWQKSIDLSVNIYKATDLFPKKEQYSIVQQLNRAAVSVASNIAEGAGRNSDKEFVNFLSIAVGSCCELETQLIISNRIGFVSNENLDILVKSIFEIQNMIYSLQTKIKSKS